MGRLTERHRDNMNDGLSLLGMFLWVAPILVAIVAFLVTCVILWYYGHINRPTAVAAGTAASLTVAPWYMVAGWFFGEE